MTSEKWKRAQFFYFSFAGDTGDTSDMKNLKIDTNVQVKPKSVDWQTRQFDCKGVPLFLDFFASDSGDTDDIRKMNECPIFFIPLLLVTLVTPVTWEIWKLTQIFHWNQSVLNCWQDGLTPGSSPFSGFFCFDDDDVGKMYVWPIFFWLTYKTFWQFNSWGFPFF